MKSTLVVLAAGMGSRYGGLKQLDAFGPGGETLMDYSVGDAIASGFNKIVFVIRKDFQEAFEEKVLNRWQGKAELALSFQSMGENRKKPWGTLHALIAAKAECPGPFAMVNADDFYGKPAYLAMQQYLANLSGSNEGAMVGYRLKDTLSDYGSVTRAVCSLDAQSRLQGMKEIKALSPDNLASFGLNGSELVSMNFFGFSNDMFGIFERRFEAFLSAHGGEVDSECLVPETVDQLVKEGSFKLNVLDAGSTWFGVTYPRDKERVRERLLALA